MDDVEVEELAPPAVVPVPVDAAVVDPVVAEAPVVPVPVDAVFPLVDVVDPPVVVVPVAVVLAVEVGVVDPELVEVVDPAVVVVPVAVVLAVDAGVVAAVVDVLADDVGVVDVVVADVVVGDEDEVSAFEVEPEFRVFPGAIETVHHCTELDGVVVT